ncbi:MAG: glycerol-3-phosphate 1-O-acyltransferase PlsY [Geminicoccaceae bacterium]
MIDPLGGPAFWWPYILGFVISYLIGAIPFGLILTRLSGAGDLRAIGSGNIGATNVLRTGRKSLALATLLLDALKGGIPVWLGGQYFGPDMAIIAGLGAVLGHCFPIWLWFKGGKGVATAAGVVLVLTPLSGVLILFLFAAVVAASRYVSLGSILAAIAAAPIAYILGHVQAAELYAAIALVVLLKHHTNIRRLLAGNESKVALKSPSSSDNV